MSASGPNQISSQSPLELLHPDWHLHRVERILHHIVSIELIASPHHNVRIRLLWAGKQQELDARRRLEARQAEVARFEALDARGGRSPGVWLCGRSRDGVYGARDGVDAVEGSGENERIVGSEVLKAWGEGAVVDETACLVDNEESEDDPAEGVRIQSDCRLSQELTLWPSVVIIASKPMLFTACFETGRTQGRVRWRCGLRCSRRVWGSRLACDRLQALLHLQLQPAVQAPFHRQVTKEQTPTWAMSLLDHWLKAHHSLVP